MADVYRHTSEYGETFLAVSSTKINNEGIKMIGRSITNFFTETTVSTLDELYRGKWQNCFAGTAVEGDSHLQWAGLVLKSHVDTADSAHIYTWLFSECILWVSHLSKASYSSSSLPPLPPITAGEPSFKLLNF